MKYASRTSVPIDRSKAEIERLLVRYGADHFASGWTKTHATIGFRFSKRLVRFELPLPLRANFRSEEAWAQHGRAAWRALTLVIKAKLEAVDSGITTFENEFLAHIVLPGGRTVGEAIAPEIDAAYASGRAPQLLLSAAPEEP